jgi:hypothetical protein
MRLFGPKVLAVPTLFVLLDKLSLAGDRREFGQITVFRGPEVTKPANCFLLSTTRQDFSLMQINEALTRFQDTVYNLLMA